MGILALKLGLLLPNLRDLSRAKGGHIWIAIEA
jgi:hypothetical protein